MHDFLLIWYEGADPRKIRGFPGIRNLIQKYGRKVTGAVHLMTFPTDVELEKLNSKLEFYPTGQIHCKKLEPIFTAF